MRKIYFEVDDPSGKERERERQARRLGEKEIRGRYLEGE